MIKLKKEMDSDVLELTPEEALEALELADEIRADHELMREVNALKGGTKKPKSVDDLKKMEKEMPDDEPA